MNSYAERLAIARMHVRHAAAREWLQFARNAKDDTHKMMGMHMAKSKIVNARDLAAVVREMREANHE